MTASTLTGLQKVAVLLKSMPAPVVDKVMRHLDPRHANLVKSEIAKLDERKDLSQKLFAVLDEAVNMLGPGGEGKEPSLPTSAGKAAEKRPRVDIRVDGMSQHDAAPPSSTASGAVVRGSTATPAEGLKSSAAGQPNLAHSAGAAGPDGNGDPLRALATLPPDLLASALEGENTRTASLLMNCLDIEAATQVYKRLSPAKRKDVSMRFTEQVHVPDELLRRIAQGVLKKCLTLQEASAANPSEAGGREKRMAALLRGLERAERAEMLAVLEAADAELTGRVKAMLYTFEDILRMENISVQKLLSEVDVKSLSQALRGADKDIEAKILANLSKRAQESLREEISLTGMVPPPKVKAARQTLVEAIQRLDQRGELMINE